MISGRPENSEKGWLAGWFYIRLAGAGRVAPLTSYYAQVYLFYLTGASGTQNQK